MAESRSYSPNYETVRKAADAALMSPDGIAINYRVDAVTPMSACALKARSFQQSFTSLRARMRRLDAKVRGEIMEHSVVRDSFARGPYDDLVCQRLPLADEGGWCVTLRHAHVLIDELEIIDIATGQPLSEIGKNKSELEVFYSKAIHGPSAFTHAERARAMELDPFFWTGSLPGNIGLPPEPFTPPRWFFNAALPAPKDWEWSWNDGDPNGRKPAGLRPKLEITDIVDTPVESMWDEDPDAE